MDANTLEAIKYTVSSLWWMGISWLALKAITNAIVGIYIYDKS